MKYLLLVTLLLVPSMAKAQTLVSKETANTYFANCVKTASPTQDMSVEGQELLCACTAARLTQFFTMEEWQAMMSSDPAIQRPAYNKMMTDIYAPCMAQPTRERYMKRCARTAGLEQRICACTADRLALHVQNSGPQIFARLLAQNPNMQDPWAALESDPEFNAYIDKAGQSCTP